MEHVLCMAVLEQVNADPNPQSGAVEPVSVDPAEILALEDEPTEEITVAYQTDPPTRTYRNNEGENVVEALTLVGWVEAPRTSKELLEHYGIDLRFATHDPKARRWNDCLFSEAVADLLEELAPKGEFPFAFEAGPTLAEVVWWDGKAHGVNERPELEAHFFCKPGSAEGLEDPEGHLRTRRGTPTDAQ